MVAEKPYEALTSLAMASSLGGTSVFDSIPFVTKDPLNMFSDPLSVFFDSLDEGVIASTAEALID